MSLKQIIDNYPHLTSEQIIQKIRKYDIVSFDVFDTLLKRDVRCETDVFDYVEQRFNDRFGEKLSGFKKLRIDAEQAAQKNGREATLSGIYLQLSTKLLATVNQAEIEELKKIEMTFEEEIFCPNPEILDVYRYCVMKGKRILAVSDMYFGADFIYRQLKKNGFDKIDALYVSSDVNKSKKKGSLYRYLLVQEKLSPKRIIHIGDSKRNDYLVPRMLGIHAICIAKNPCHTQYWHYKDRKDDDAIYAFINNRLPYISERQIAIGYEVYGPLLYLFVKWLTERLEPSKPILFFSRDCYVVKQAYDIVTGSKQKSIYFLASRKSLSLASLSEKNSVKDIETLISIEPELITLKDFLRKFGLEPELYRNLAKECGLVLSAVFRRDKFMKDPRVLKFWKMLENEIKTKAACYHKGFKQYYSQTVGCTSTIQVVDIGWRCTMQYCLEEILSDSVNVYGYYIGVKNSEITKRMNCEGFYINKEFDLDKDALISASSGLLEAFFTAPHGSVSGYADNGMVLYDPYECESDKEGKYLSQNLQKGALQFVRDMVCSPLREYIRSEGNFMFRGMKQLAVNPRWKDMKLFEHFPFQTSNGIYRMTDSKSLVYYFFHLKRYIRDFVNAPWKIAFMKRLIKLPLPYFKVYKRVYCFFRRKAIKRDL